MKESRAASKAVTVRSPFLAVARLTVDIRVGPVASTDGVQGLGAVTALEALAMPFTALCQHLLSSEHDATAARATLARGSLDSRGVDHRCLGCLFTKY